MNKSLYTKLIVIILALILALMTVVGAFLLRGVQSFYLSEFYEQMKTVFSDAEMVDDLRAHAREEDISGMAEVLRVYSSNLGINSGTRNYYVLDGATGGYLDGSDEADISLTPNILTAIAGSEGYASNVNADYMDVALPISGGQSGYIIYILDNKSTVKGLSNELFTIIAEALAVGLAISIFLGLLLAKALITPIQSLTKAAEKVAAGDFSEHLTNDAVDEIGTLTHTFNDMAGQLQGNIEEMKKSEKMRKEFVANVSHELRTPITSIRTYAETMQENFEALDIETRERFLSVIINEADRITSIVQDLLVLSRFDAGNYSLSLAGFSFEKSVKDVYDAQRLEARRRNHEFSVEIKGRMEQITGDRLRIEQVLTNMISNAIKYTPDGGRISVTAGQEDDVVWCSVRDNGIGIPEEDLEHIFERFYRVDKARSRESGGTGLGLSIAYEIVQRHSGEISVSSKKGGGTVMALTLPVSGPDAPADVK